MSDDWLIQFDDILEIGFARPEATDSTLGFCKWLPDLQRLSLDNTRVTDAGLVHPYFRIRTLESALHDRVKIPTVIFYPGRRSGQYGLCFLGFYSVDGNYRSTLIGGQV